MCWEPPHGAARASGGLLGVIGGEAWRGSRGGFEHGGPVSAALVDLCRAYVSEPGDGPPIDVAQRHEGVPGPGWLLPVAFMRPDPAERQRDTRDLAAAAGMGSYALPACVAYVELAAHLFAAEDADQAVRAATGQPALSPSPAPRLLGVGAVDGLAAGVWALGRPGNLAAVLPSLVECGEEVVAPWVAAAAAGLLGVRDGCAAVPAQWHRRLRRRQRDACSRLAEAIVLARHHDVLDQQSRAGVG
jgi:hypothetical protein